MANILTGQLWSAYYKEVRLRCASVPEPVMDHFLREASRDFMRRTLMWQMLIGAMNLTAAQAFYILGKNLVASGQDWPIETGDAPMERVRMIRLYRGEVYGGGPVYEKTTKWLDANWPNWQYATGRLPVFWFSFDSITEGQGIRFVPIPTETLSGAVWLTAALSNPVAAGSAGTALNYDFNPELPFKYTRDIAAGAVRGLCMLPEKPWTNPALAAYENDVYETAVGKMILRVMKDGVRQTLVADGGASAGFA